MEKKENLYSISTWVEACNLANVETAKTVGERIIETMNGITSNDFVFCKKYQTILFTAETQRGRSGRQLDPSLLFQ